MLVIASKKVVMGRPDGLGFKALTVNHYEIWNT